MTGNLTAALAVVVMVCLLLVAQRSLPRHAFLVGICWAIVIVALWIGVPPIQHFLTTHFTGTLVGGVMGNIIAVEFWRKERRNQHNSPLRG
jgi:hypothetical protein